jgi:CheY-like chemotaxis protein
MSLVGNLEDLGLGEILQIVSLSRKSGILALHSMGREGHILFRQGQVIRATSSIFQQNLGESLIQKGIIDLPTLKKALAIQEKDGFTERLGSILVNRFSISADTIETVVREQIEGVVYSLFAWAEGTFDFELQDNVEAIDDIKMDPVQFMLDQGLNPQFLAMEGSRIIDERRHRGELIDEEHHTGGTQSEEGVDAAFDLLQAPPAMLPATVSRPLVLVDDDAATRETIVPVLEGGGYEVFAFEKSEDTLIKIDTIYREGARPTVLVDLIMPRMDGSGILGGVELLELIRNNFKDLPVLAMADYHNRDAERKVTELGVPLIAKPRKGELTDDGVIGDFGDRLVQELARVEAGGGPVSGRDSVNIGDELRMEMGEDLASSPVTVEQSTGLTLLRGMLEELNNPALGGGIILLILRFAAEFMNRAVIFIVKRDEIVGLGQFGIDGSEADAKIRNLRIPRGEDSLFTGVIESRIPAKMTPGNSRWNRHLLDQLGGGFPAEVFLGPVVSEDKVVAVLYGDNLPAEKPIGDTDSLDIFLSQAGLAMEKALLQRRLKEKSPEGM